MLLDEDLDERLLVAGVLEFAVADVQLAFEEFEELADVGAEDFGDGAFAGAVVLDDDHVGRDLALALGERVESGDGLFDVGAGDQGDDDLDLVGRGVLDGLDGDLLAARGLLDGGDERLGRLAEGDLADDDDVGAARFEAGARGDAAVAVAVLREVEEAAGLEVGQHLERLVLDDGDFGLEQLHEVVREDERREADGDALGAEHEQQRELRGQQQGLLVAPVVAGDELGRLLVEDLVAGELGEAALDVARRGGAVAGVDVAEVALPLDEVALVGEVHEGLADGGVAMRVVLHRVADDVGHLDEASVVLLVEGVEDAPLDGLEAVLDGGDGAVADRVGGELEEVAVHDLRERAAGGRYELGGGGRLVVAVGVPVAVFVERVVRLLRRGGRLARGRRGGRRRRGVVRRGLAGGGFGRGWRSGRGDGGLAVFVEEEQLLGDAAGRRRDGLAAHEIASRSMTRLSMMYARRSAVLLPM